MIQPIWMQMTGERVDVIALSRVLASAAECK